MKVIFTSRKFWAACAGVILVVLTAFFPNFPQIDNQITDLVYIICAYILGTSLEGNFQDAGQKLQMLLHSRKLWASLAGVLAITLRAMLPDFPLDETQVTALILTIAAYVVGTGAQDGLTRLNPSLQGES